MSFNLKRVLLLIINDIRLHKKVLMVAALTLLALFMLIPIHLSASYSAYFAVLYIAGFIISGAAFNDIHDSRKGYLFLMLPCSNFERFFSKWFVTSLGFVLALLLVFYVFSLLSFVVNALVFNALAMPLNILQPALWFGIGKYIILQSVVLLGAILFKKHPLLKTALSVVCLFLLFSMISGMFTWSFCPSCMIDHSLWHKFFSESLSLFWLLLAPFCWSVAYLRLTECELQ